jgi:hypothetical protein
MKVTKSWLESVEAFRKAKKAGIETKTAEKNLEIKEKELEQTTRKSTKENEEERNQLLLQEAKEKQRQEYPRGNVTWPESWYRERFKQLGDTEMESFIAFLKRNRKL